MRWRARISALLATAALAACDLAPRYHTPPTPTPAAFKELGNWQPAAPADDVPRGPWWKTFNDPTLDTLEARAGVGNQNIKAALARYDEARLAATAARAAFFPTVTGNVYDLRERSSPNFSTITTGKPYNDYLLGAQLSWEIDVWGKIRNQVNAAGNLAKASQADLAAMDLSIRAELAGDYFSLRADDASQAVLDDTIVAYRKALTLTRQRFQGGVSAEADVDQAETQYQNARTQAADMRLARAQLEHAIAVLAGEIPSTFTLPAAPATDAAPPVVNPGLPSTLLERRPDVAAAERRVRAANAEIGVARAAYFPDFTFSASYGLESALGGNWLTYPSRIWSLGPQAVVTLFDAGRISALTAEARAAYDETAANYRQTVLTAYQQVEDNLAALRELAQESESQAAATAAADRALTQSQDRYQGGIVTYLDVVINENTALQSRLSLITIRARRMTADVALIKALGGGWTNKPQPAKTASAIPVKHAH